MLQAFSSHSTVRAKPFFSLDNVVCPVFMSQSLNHHVPKSWRPALAGLQRESRWGLPYCGPYSKPPKLDDHN